MSLAWQAESLPSEPPGNMQLRASLTPTSKEQALLFMDNIY